MESNEGKPTTPILSVLIVTYNHGKFIGECLLGIIKQKTDFNFEVIIGDDGSTDNNQTIIEDIINDCQNPKIKFKPLLHKKNLGPPKFPAKNNFKLSINACTGKYIALCEGDDYWTDSSKLQKQVDFLEENKDFSLCFHNVEIVNENSVKLDNYGAHINWNNQSFSSNELINGKFLFHSCSITFRNNFIIPKWFYKVPTGDKALQKLLGTKGKAFCFNDIMGAYRVHSSGISKTNEFFNSNIREQGVRNELLMHEGIYNQAYGLSQEVMLQLQNKILWYKIELNLFQLNLIQRFWFIFINPKLVLIQYCKAFNKSKLFAIIRLLSYFGNFAKKVSDKLISLIFK